MTKVRIYSAIVPKQVKNAGRNTARVDNIGRGGLGRREQRLPAAASSGYFPSGSLALALGRLHSRSASSSVTWGNLTFRLSPGPISTVSAG
jgi:hypothetical protein